MPYPHSVHGGRGTPNEHKRISDLKFNNFEKKQETDNTTPTQGGPFAG